MNYARKWHEAGSKRVESRVENDTNQDRKWQKQGSKMERTRLENGTNQARKWHKQGSKLARKNHEPGSKPARKILQFVSFRLKARHAKWLELRHDRKIDVTQMTGNSVHKAKNDQFNPKLNIKAWTCERHAGTSTTAPPPPPPQEKKKKKNRKHSSRKICADTWKLRDSLKRTQMYKI